MDVHTRQGKYATSQTYRCRSRRPLALRARAPSNAIGANVSDLAVGDRVAYCLSWGAMPNSPWCCVAGCAGSRQAGAGFWRQPPCFTTHGHYLAYDVGRLGPGVTCLVHSASGGIGQLLVQLGARLGPRSMPPPARTAKAAVAKHRGAKEVVLLSIMADSPMPSGCLPMDGAWTSYSIRSAGRHCAIASVQPARRAWL